MKRPDGMSLAPWSSGKLLVWDATCSDTFAPSRRSQATHAPGEVAARAEKRKEAKYISLPAGHQFVPVETMGAMGPRTLLFLKELGKRMRAQIKLGRQGRQTTCFKDCQQQCRGGICHLVAFWRVHLTQSCNCLFFSSQDVIIVQSFIV